MPNYAQDLSIHIDGVESSLRSIDNPLARAVVISLFTWRRAAPDDKVEGTRWGWWADGFDGNVNDRIGSRLWVLSREKVTNQTMTRAREYAEEALLWLTDDGVATKVTVTVERRGMDGLALRALIEREGGLLDLRFDNVWSFFNV